MLQIAREKVIGVNKYVVGVDLVKWRSPRMDDGEIFWIAKDDQTYVDVCNSRKLVGVIGFTLKPGEGPINIKIVRVDQ